jgi:hypothetical protein
MHAAIANHVPNVARHQEIDRYARCIENSKRIRWDIDRDVIRGRSFDFARSSCPDGLSKVDQLAFLQPAEARMLSQIQGRTYANMFALVERFIGAKTAELGRDHALGNQVAFEALVPAHRRGAEAPGDVPPPRADGRRRHADRLCLPAAARRGRRRRAVQVELGGARPHPRHRAVQPGHYRSSIEPDDGLSELWKDVFLFHWKEESQHAVLDELEWRREDARLSGAERDRGVAELIELVGAVDGICQMQAKADADFFLSTLRRPFGPAEAAAVHAVVLNAYRWQYIVSGGQEPRFQQVLKALVTPAQMQRILLALAPFFADA